MVDDDWPTFREPDDGVELRVHHAGEVALDSGALVVCDPFVPMGGEPLAQRVTVGRYPVELLLRRANGDTRVAMARVRFGSSSPSRWKLAVWPGQDERTLGPGQIFGYGVDAGTGCFADPAALKALGERADPVRILKDMGHTWSVGSLEHGARSLVAFSSGGGDGVYASWWGFDANDDPVVLVTDFGELEADWPEVGRDPEFRRAHANEALDRLLALAPTVGRGTQAFSEAYELAAEVRGLGADLGDSVGRILSAVFEHADNDAAQLCLTSAIKWSEDSVQAALAEQLERAGYERGWPVLEAVADRLGWETLLPGFAEWVYEGGRRNQGRWAVALSIAARAHTGHASFFAPAAQFVDKDWSSLLRAKAKTPEELQRARGKLGRMFIEPSLQLLSQAPSLPQRTIEGLVRLLSEDDAPWCRAAMRLLGSHDATRVRPFFTATNPSLRVLAAGVILRAQADDAEALATLRAVIDDPGLSLDGVRAEAVGALCDKEQRERAYLALAIAGSRVALLQYTYMARGDEAMEGLSRVVGECDAPRVVEEAKSRLASFEKSRA